MADVGDKNRAGQFYYKQAHDYEEFMYNQFIKVNLGLTFYLLKPDHEALDLGDDLYGDKAPDLYNLSEPIELVGNVNLENEEVLEIANSAGGATRPKYSKAIFTITNKQLKEKDLEILPGDIIKYTVRPEEPEYFVVTNPNFFNDSNTQSRGRIDPLVRRIECDHIFSDMIQEVDGESGDVSLI